MAEQEPNPKPKTEQEIDLEHELVDAAFRAGEEHGSQLEFEKKILAVAFLLENCSGYGNEAVDDIIADGLAVVLRNAAKDAARLRKELLTLRQD
jgi:hypothetical protein